MQPFGFESAPERFHGGVIIAMALGTHAGKDVGSLQQSAIAGGGVLGSSIGMVEEALSGTAKRQGLLQGFCHQGTGQGVAGGPADNFSTVEIHDGSQVKPAFERENISNIADPNAVDASRWWSLSQTVWGDGLVMMGVGGFGFKGSFLAGFKIEDMHVTGDAVATARQAGPLQADGQTRTAVDFAMGDKEAGQFGAQDFILNGAGAQRAGAPGIVGTASHL